MSRTLEDLVREYVGQENMRFEGDTGVENLNKVAKALGYKESGFLYGSSLEEFLSDNPGACDAIIEWIGQQNIPDWKEALESELPEDEGGDEEEETD